MLLYELRCSSKMALPFLELLTQILQQIECLIEVIARILLHSQHGHAYLQHLSEVALLDDLGIEHEQAKLMTEEQLHSVATQIVQIAHHPLYQRLQVGSDQVASFD